MCRAIALRAAVGFAVTVTIVMGSASPARAQAWLPAQGEGTVSVVFSDLFMKYHYGPDTPYDRGQIQAETLLVDVTYGLTDRLAVSFGIPWVASRYNGPFPHQLVDLSGPVPVFGGPNPIDDGTYHSTFQDFRFDLRYNISKKGFVLTPFVGSITPSHDYTYFAHAAPGRRLNELQIGAAGGKLLDSLLPGLVIQGRYSYGFTEQVLDISHNRSNVDLELGYFVTPKLRLLALSAAQITHGGLDYGFRFSDAAPNGIAGILTNGVVVDFPPDVRAHHDQVDRVNFLNLGGGIAYSLTDNVDIFGSMLHVVSQRNGHGLDRGLTVGLSWGFTTKSAHDRAIASAERSLVKCVCEKSAN